MAKALLIIGYTNDFVADKGSLTVGKSAQTLAPEIMRLADQFLSQHDYVIFPTDGYRLNDPFNPETKLYPAHNIIGTTGQKLYGQVGSWFDQHHDDSHVYKLNKNRYSSFQNTNLDNYLRERRIGQLPQSKDVGLVTHDLTVSGNNATSLLPHYTWLHHWVVDNTHLTNTFTH